MKQEKEEKEFGHFFIRGTSDKLKQKNAKRRS